MYYKILMHLKLTFFSFNIFYCNFGSLTLLVIIKFIIFRTTAYLRSSTDKNYWLCTRRLEKKVLTWIVTISLRTKRTTWRRCWGSLGVRCTRTRALLSKSVRNAPLETRPAPPDPQVRRRVLRPKGRSRKRRTKRKLRRSQDKKTTLKP